jgi:hypothetical protein
MIFELLQRKTFLYILKKGIMDGDLFKRGYVACTVPDAVLKITIMHTVVTGADSR